VRKSTLSRFTFTERKGMPMMVMKRGPGTISPRSNRAVERLSWSIPSGVIKIELRIERPSDFA